LSRQERQPPIIEIEPLLLQPELPQLLLSTYGFAVESFATLTVGDSTCTFVAKSHATKYVIKLHHPHYAEWLDFSLRLAHVLNTRWGIKGVVAPLPTVTGSLRAMLGPFPVSVHPFIHGDSVAAAGPIDDTRMAQIGMLIGEIHRSAAVLEFTGGRAEQFDIECVDILSSLLALEPDGNGTQRLVLELLAQNREELQQAMHVLQRLRERALATPGRLAITHGDATLHNVMLDEAGGIHLIDWDSGLLAPVERDLVVFSETGFESFKRG
jgi:spectinomycin phosphotransferase